jgi:hypothetical protein
MANDLMLPNTNLPVVPNNITTALPGNAMQDGGQRMNQSPPYGIRQQQSGLVFQADGTPFRSSGRNAMKGDDRTYIDFHNLNPYEKVLHTYQSSNGYADNSYLIFFQREEWYQERQKYSIRAAPAFKSIVDAMVSPVFDKTIGYTSTDPWMQEYIKNADATGTCMQDINETAVTHALMMNLTFGVMDNFDDAAGVATIADGLQQRKFPYVYEKMPHQVYKWKTNNWGKLEWISFWEKQEKIPDPVKKDAYTIRTYYRRWDNEMWTMYYEEPVKGKFGEFTEKVVQTAKHGLNHMPIYPMLDFAKNNNLTNFPAPGLLDLANMSFILYNIESWILLLDVYNFPTLTLPPQEGAQIAMSVANAIEVPMGGHAPGYISPPSNCLESLIKSADRIEEKMLRRSSQLGVSATKPSQQSGVSKQWDFRAGKSRLMKSAHASQAFDEWQAKTFEEYVHRPVNFFVNYPLEFAESDEQERVTQSLLILNGKTAPPEALASELWQEVARVIFNDDPDRAQKIVAGIKTEQTQKVQAAIPAPDGVPGSMPPVPPEEGAPEGDKSKSGDSINDEEDFSNIIQDVVKKFANGKKTSKKAKPEAQA